MRLILKQVCQDVCLYANIRIFKQITTFDTFIIDKG